MTVKSIIAVDVQTGPFERFQSLYNEYQAQLEETPGIWADVAKEHEGLAKGFKSVTAALLAQNQFAREMEGTQDKQEKHLSTAERLWTSVGRTTKGVAGSIWEATKALTKWTGILSAVGGLLGAGGLFGIDRMAAGAAGQRRSAMGLGLTTGEQRAFQVDFQRLVDPDAFLGWLSEMETDVSKQGPAFALTGHGLTGETGKDAIELLKSIRELARRTPLNNLGPILGAYGLQLDSEQQRRFHDMGDEEFGKLIARFQPDQAALNIPEDVGQKWQDFTTQMELAKSSIFKAFVEGLAPLAPSLTKLSDAFTHFLEVLLKSPLIEHAIDDVSKWLNSFAGTLSAPAFLDSVKSFVSDVGDLAKAIHAVTHPGETISNTLSDDASFFAPDSQTLKDHPSFLSTIIDRTNRQWGLPVGLMQTVKALEHSGVTAVSPKGAMGVFQLMPDTFKQYADYGATNPFDPLQNTDAAARFLGHLDKKYDDDVPKILAAYNYGEGNVDKLLKAHPDDWQGFLPRETRQYLMNAAPLQRAYGGAIKVQVNVTAPPGFSAVATASALAH